MKSNNRYWDLEEIGKDQWLLHWDRVEFPNLMQSWGYGEAKKLQGWNASRFLLRKKDGSAHGLLQVLVRQLPSIGGIARINRGPMMFKNSSKNNVSNEDIKNILLEIRRVAFVKRWWLILMSPELSNGSSNLEILLDSGYFQRKRAIPYGSLRLNLQLHSDKLLENLNGKWRNLLRKGLKQKVTVEKVIDIGTQLKLINIYEDFQVLRNFRGIPKGILLNMLALSGFKQELSIYRTTSADGNETTGFIFIINSGNTSTYLIGWSSDEGRMQQSNYILLWEAINIAKIEGALWFDLGGISARTPKGIAHFKKGLNAIPYENSGEFFSMPKIS